MDLYVRLVTEALPVTIAVSAAAWLLGTVLGTGLGMAGLSRRRWLRETQFFVSTVLRSLPELLAIYLLFYGITAHGVELTPFTATVLALGVTQAGFWAESVRAGVQVVGPRQFEAAYSLGLTTSQTYRKVIFPQLVSALTSPSLNMFVALTKLTAIAAAVGLPELLHTGRSVMDRTYDVLPVVVALAVTYLMLTVPLTFLVKAAEDRWRKRTARQTMPVFS
ncbi:hypothetical protein CA850_22815 [Micromonospora echinospora]|uniref:Polar amino acid transport system permease protein n=1 Tax=Micromonospora echinospora TaxID=1877 RepID=A0A1C4Z2P5_MICEC|nr:amino acid ABC transporter permease [Micromonospora echinospora]OZV77514.1 hypothetical protein CA850_22815 [Micromonospora echinospora]SCF27186.1 polar amino acid transport system permease protein [Micromonospora echinospora]